MTRHINTDVLARYRSGDLGGRRSRRVGAHLAGCRRCAATSSGLADVSQLLRAAATPPMPTDITARIEAALAAESAQRTRTAGDPAGVPSEGPRAASGRLSPAGTRPRAGHGAGWPALRLPVALRSPVALRVLAGTAVAVVVVGGAFTAAQLAGGTSSSGGAGSAAAAPSSGGPHASSPDDSPMVRTAAPESSPGPAGAATGSAGGAASSAAGPALKYRAAHGTATIVPVAAGADFGRAGLAGQVGALLMTEGQRTALASPSGAGSARSFSGIPVTKLEGCVSRVAGGGQVRLVDVDHYQGSKATIIVVAPAGGGRQQIWVVGPGCSRSDSHVITRSTLPGTG